MLELDHEDPATKVAGIAGLASMNISWDRVQAEVAKCSVRGANCHRRRTSDLMEQWRSAVEPGRRATDSSGALNRLQTILGT